MQTFTQPQEFLCFSLIGMIICILFDFFRSMRKNFKTSDLVTLIEDIIFLTISAILIMLGVLVISKGVLRFYILLGFLFGMTIYLLLFSKIILKGFNILLTIIKKILNLIKTIFKRILKNTKYIEEN